MLATFRIWFPIAALLAVLTLVPYCQEVYADTAQRPALPPLDEAVEVRPTPSGLTILVFAVEHRELEAAFATSPSDPEPVCTRVVLIERDGFYLARRNGRACVYRIVPEPVMWRWPDRGGPFASWIGKTFTPME